MKSLYDVLGVQAPGEHEPVCEVIDPLTAESFSKAVVESREYRASIVRRILLDELPPQVECRLLDHALGKPIERIEVQEKTTPLAELPAEELEQRALLLLERARRLRVHDPSSAVH